MPHDILCLDYKDAVPRLEQHVRAAKIWVWEMGRVKSYAQLPDRSITFTRIHEKSRAVFKGAGQHWRPTETGGCAYDVKLSSTPCLNLSQLSLSAFLRGIYGLTERRRV